MEYDNFDNERTSFEALKGKKIISIDGLKKGSERIKFLCSDKTEFWLTYYDDCCASCSIEDVCGDIENLIGHEILLAEEVSSNQPDAEEQSRRDKEKAEAEKNDGYYYGAESETWTFYKLATIKGSVTIRWYGSSNGYYSESATFERVNPTSAEGSGK
jgi:hypothetical protein